MKNTSDFYSKFLDLCLEHNASPVEGAGLIVNRVVQIGSDRRIQAPARLKVYMEYIANMPCEGYPDDCGVEYAVQAHHYGPHSMSQKTDDYMCIPLCPKCHDYWHKNYAQEDKEYYLELILGHLINFLKIK